MTFGAGVDTDDVKLVLLFADLPCFGLDLGEALSEEAVPTCRAVVFLAVLDRLDRFESVERGSPEVVEVCCFCCAADLVA